MTTTPILSNANSATVTSGGTNAPLAGTNQNWTVTTAAAWPSLASGTLTITVIDKLDLGKTSGYEIMQVTALANGTGVTWAVTRGVESTIPWTHAAGFTVVPVITQGTLDGRYALESGLLAEVSRAELAEGTFAVVTDGNPAGALEGATWTVGSFVPSAMGPRDIYISDQYDPLAMLSWGNDTNYGVSRFVTFNSILWQNQAGMTIYQPTWDPTPWTPVANLTLVATTAPLPNALIGVIGASGFYADGAHVHPEAVWDVTDQGIIAQPYDGALSFSQQILPAAGTIYGCKVKVAQSATVTYITLQVGANGSVLTQGECFAALYAGPPAGSASLLGDTPDMSGTTYTVSCAGGGTGHLTGGTGFVANSMVGGQFTIAGVTASSPGYFTVTAVTSSSTCTVTPTISGASFSAKTMTPVTIGSSDSWLLDGTCVMPIVSTAGYGTPVTVTPGYYYIVFFANGTTMPSFTRASNSAQTNFPLVGTNPAAAGSFRFFSANASTTTSPSTLGTLAANNTSYWGAIS